MNWEEVAEEASKAGLDEFNTPKNKAPYAEAIQEEDDIIVLAEGKENQRRESEKGTSGMIQRSALRINQAAFI